MSDYDDKMQEARDRARWGLSEPYMDDIPTWQQSAIRQEYENMRILSGKSEKPDYLKLESDDKSPQAGCAVYLIPFVAAVLYYLL